MYGSNLRPKSIYCREDANRVAWGINLDHMIHRTGTI